MFFGLFSSHLPFIIVGLVYFASFSVITVQRLLRFDEPDSAAVENDDHGRVFSEISESNCIYQFAHDQQLIYATEPQVHPDLPVPEIPITNFTFCLSPIRDVSAGSFFVRPPPFIA